MKINEAIKLTMLVESIPTGRFEYDGIAYNNISGAGSVPDNSNVLYRGFAAVMDAQQFLALAAPASRERDAKSIADAILDQDLEIGSPFLSIAIERDDDWNITDVYVTGHEGRARALAIDMLSRGYRSEDQNRKGFITGDIVVHFFGAMGTRSRHLDREFFDFIKMKGIRAERSSRYIKPRFNRVFHNPNAR